MNYDPSGDFRLREAPILPSLMTSGNLVCGFLSICYAMAGRYELAAWAIFVAMVFDALDGKIARMTNSSSAFGIELDSLADVVSFGAAPAFLVRTLADAHTLTAKLATLGGMLFVVCAALRLARFNIETTTDEESHQDFMGLPTPGAAGLIAALVILHVHLYNDYAIFILSRLLPFVALLLAPLMISKLPYPHLVNRLLRGQRPFEYFIELLLFIGFVAWTRPFSLALLFGAYVASGLVQGVIHEPVEDEAAEFNEES